MRKLLSPSILAVLLSTIFLIPPAYAAESIVPIMAIQQDDNLKEQGIIAFLVLEFERRQDTSGLIVTFNNTPGQFSRQTQTAIEYGIRIAAKLTGENTDSWTFKLTVPYPGLTVHGVSCQAMVAISAILLSTYGTVPEQIIMTGTLQPDGTIGPVGGVPNKVLAAGIQFPHILVPDIVDIDSGDWQTPFLVEVQPTATFANAFAVFKAYLLTTSK